MLDASFCFNFSGILCLGSLSFFCGTLSFATKNFIKIWRHFCGAFHLRQQDLLLQADAARLISSLALAFLVSSSDLLVVGFCHDSSFCGAHVLRVEHVESKDVKKTSMT